MPINLGKVIFQRAVSAFMSPILSASSATQILPTGDGISLEEPHERLTLPGFLFDMNRFFQALLSRFLAEHLPGYTLEDQHRLHGMFGYVAAHNPQRRVAPTPRPDFVLWQGQKQKVVAVLDAKYRDLWNTTLPVGMLYQLAIYALSQLSGGRATILYPTLDATADEAIITIRRPTDGAEQGRVGLRPVRLDLLDDLLESGVPISAGRQRARRVFAHALAFGQRPGAASFSGPSERP